MTWLVDTLIATGALIALVLVLRRPVARWFGPGMAYALWALPLLRLVLPPLMLPAAPASPDAEIIVLQGGAPVAAAAEPVPGLVDTVLAYAPWFQAVWLAGAMAFLLWRGWGYAAMRRSLENGGVEVGKVGAIRLIESPAAQGPVAFGIVDPVVALPIGFMAATPQRERDLAIAHELEHHRGRDLAVNIAIQPLMALHWFNPLGWLAWRALRRDQEAACDARVITAADPAEREAYGRLIAAYACNRSPVLASSLACPIIHEKSIIHRLRSLTMTQPTQGRRLAGRLLIGGAALALPLTATITYAAGEPEPAAPSAPPAAPTWDAKEVQIDADTATEPGKPGRIHKIVVVEKGEGDAVLSTRTITRGNRTYVFKTTKPLSDAEVEQRIAGIEKGQTVSAEAFVIKAGNGPVPPVPPVPPVSLVASADQAGRREVRTIIVSDNGPGGGGMEAHSQQTFSGKCSSKPFVAQASQAGEGKRGNAYVMICGHDGDKAGTLMGLRRAREKVAADPKMPAGIKADVLGQLDAEIARVEKES